MDGDDVRDRQLGMAAPFFLGAPWVPKYGGTGSDMRFREWKAQIQAMLRAQAWTAAQQCDFVLGALEGEAKREVWILEAADRATTDHIFQYLEDLYGDKVSLALLRSMFFECKQKPGETTRAFTLRLRELFQRLQRRDPGSFGRADRILRDQFLLGLRGGDLRQELKHQVRREPDLTFDRVRREALFYEEDHSGEMWQAPVHSIGESRDRPTHLQGMDWKQELRNEILQEVRGQIVELGKTLSDELKEGFQAQRMASQASWTNRREGGLQGRGLEQPSPGSSRDPRVGSRPPVNNRQPVYQWDNQGHPVCRKCGRSGHIGRYCANHVSLEQPLN